MSKSPSTVRRLLDSGVVLLALRVFLGIYFIRTGIVKALDPTDFLKSVHLYGFLPENPPFLLNGTAIVLPYLEVVCGLALVVGAWLRGAALQIGLMLVVFMPAILLRTAAMMQADPALSFFDVKFDCGCGTGVEIIWIKMLKNSGLFLLALMVLFSRSRLLCLDGWRTRRQIRMDSNRAGDLGLAGE
ncbi:MAG: DoxX family membrane protein [Planctomycetes bacterium]|nr:DoxX family membrane protein [Planctomycetota bacterium]